MFVGAATAFHSQGKPELIQKVKSNCNICFPLKMLAQMRAVLATQEAEIKPEFLKTTRTSCTLRN